MRFLKILVVVAVLLGISAFTLMGTDLFHSKKLRHVVVFKFKPEVTYNQMAEISENFLSLKEKVPQIIELEGGADIRFNPQNMSEDRFTHCFIVTVENEEDLKAYGVHPEHQAFSASADPLLQEVIIVDYWVE